MAIVFVGFQLVENHFLYPVVMSRTVRMNPLWVLLAVLIGANLGGVFGSTLGGPDRGPGGHSGGRGHPGHLPGGVAAHPGRRSGDGEALPEPAAGDHTDPMPWTPPEPAAPDPAPMGRRPVS